MKKILISNWYYILWSILLIVCLFNKEFLYAGIIVAYLNILFVVDDVKKLKDEVWKFKQDYWQTKDKLSQVDSYLKSLRDFVHRDYKKKQ